MYSPLDLVLSVKCLLLLSCQTLAGISESTTEGWHVFLEYYLGLACPSGEGPMPVLMLICLLQIYGVSDEERN